MNNSDNPSEITLTNFEVNLNDLKSIKKHIDILTAYYEEARDAQAWERFKTLNKPGSCTFSKESRWSSIDHQSLAANRIRGILLFSDIETFGELIALSALEAKRKLNIGTNNFKHLQKYLWLTYGIDLK